MGIGITLFGGPGDEFLGVTICGLPCGIPIDTERLRAELSRRGAYTRAVLPAVRVEEPACRISAGVRDGRTTGYPLTFLYRALSRRIPGVLRPSTGDLGAFLKLGECDGRAPESDRLTGLTLAGAVMKEALSCEGITVGSHLSALAGVDDTPFERLCPGPEALERLAERELPVFKEDEIPFIRKKIASAAERGDTVGGEIELFVIGIRGGLGDDEHPVQAEIARELFTLPYIVGVEFGRGFALTRETGYKAVDRLQLSGSKIQSVGGGFGGLCGPFTSGEPLVIRAAVAPSPLLRCEQETVDVRSMTVTGIRAMTCHISAFEVIAAAEGAVATAIYRLLYSRGV